VWWEQHREKAPRMFVEELAAVVAKLREGTDKERQQYAARSGRIIWRLLMPKTRNHVYYRVNEVYRRGRDHGSSNPDRRAASCSAALPVAHRGRATWSIRDP
jgi:hypothetical protein